MLRRRALLLPRLAAARGLVAWDAGGAAGAATAAATCPGVEPLRSQDVQQPPRWPRCSAQLPAAAQRHQQLRWHSAALPQPAYASDGEQRGGGSTRSQESEVEQQQLRDYHRRLEEMQLGRASTDPAIAAAHPEQHQHRRQPQQGLQDSAGAWPTAEQVAERLRSGRGASCSSAALPEPAPAVQDGAGDGGGSGGVLDWREVVERVRASRQLVSGEQMLTDTFG